MKKTKKIHHLDFFESERRIAANALVNRGCAVAVLQTNRTKPIRHMKPLFKSIACIMGLAAISLGPLTAAEKKNIVETAVEAGSFKTLAAALTAAGLVDALKGEGPFTVFAPTDEAFAKLPEGTLESLLLPENKDKLTGILTYHVIAGDVRSEAAVKLETATALNKKPIKLSVKDGALYLNESKVTAADVECSNGVIHIIDAVLLPPAE
jgi:transforming growth factor-beta-induced protein